MSDTTVRSSETDEPATTASKWAERFNKFEQKLSKLSDYLNPLLVKETRQALKSRQFALVFVLLLLVCWVITFFFLSMAGPGIYYAAAGRSLLFFYFIVMIFPLVVIVPFSAFRSLASEREENTYDLLSVSTLSPHQIVRGKLASALVQDGVYLSAVAPCIAFSYLLRGVDLLTIGTVLLYSSLYSVSLAMIGLFLAGLSRKKQGQILLSVLFVAGLFIGIIAAINIGMELLFQSGSIDVEEFWIVNLAFITNFVTLFALVYLATVALISSSSENRSTPLRYAMLAQQVVFIGWMAFAWLMNNYDDEVLEVLLVLSIIFWYFMGSLLTTESKELSNRVRRSLPQSQLGRMLRGLFNPGPGTGYFFAVANVTALCMLVSMALVCVEFFALSINYNTIDLMLFAVVFWAMFVVYLGIGKLVVQTIARITEMPMVAGFLIHMLLMLIGSAGPAIIQNSFRSLRNSGYSPLQWLNPWATLIEFVDSNRSPSITQTLVLFCLAICVLVLNLPSVARELMQGRVALPSRVALDEAELHPVEVKPQNPWEHDNQEQG